MASNSNPCPFCGAGNNAAAYTCVACGAPLDPSRSTPSYLKAMGVPPSPEAPASPAEPTAQAPAPAPELVTPVEPIAQNIKEGAAAVAAGLGLAGVGGLIMRTIAEALAILTAALVIGYNAGHVAPNNWLPYLLVGLAGGIAVGIAVGSVIKRSIFALFSAPFGALIGVFIAISLKMTSRGTLWLPLFTFAGACLLAVLGGRSNRVGRFQAYQRLRPILGAIGGFIFALLGFAIGHIIY
jgi:hypothetical protein